MSLFEKCMIPTAAILILFAAYEVVITFQTAKAIQRELLQQKIIEIETEIDTLKSD